MSIKSVKLPFLLLQNVEKEFRKLILINRTILADVYCSFCFVFCSKSAEVNVIFVRLYIFCVEIIFLPLKFLSIWKRWFSKFQLLFIFNYISKDCDLLDAVSRLSNFNRNKLFKSGLSKFFKGCLSQYLLSPLLDILAQLPSVKIKLPLNIMQKKLINKIRCTRCHSNY